jgi:hypothetical protein
MCLSTAGSCELRNSPNVRLMCWRKQAIWDFPYTGSLPLYEKYPHIWEVFPYIGGLSKWWEVFPCMRSIPIDGESPHIDMGNLSVQWDSPHIYAGMPKNPISGGTPISFYYVFSISSSEGSWMLPQAENQPEMHCAAPWVRLRGQNQHCMLDCCLCFVLF